MPTLRLGFFRRIPVRYVSLEFAIAQGSQLVGQLIVVPHAAQDGQLRLAARFSQPVPVHISSFDPTWGQVGQSVPVSINGSGFGTAPTVVFQTGSGITSSYSRRSDGFIGVFFAIPPNEPVGFEIFYVQNNTTTDGSPNSNPVSFQVTPAVATPVNFHITMESNLNDGSLFFTYTWSSSAGNRADLSQCRLGEQVFYPNYPVDPYIWPLPMVQSSKNPSVPTLGQGTDQIVTDQNFPPGSYQKPTVKMVSLPRSAGFGPVQIITTVLFRPLLRTLLLIGRPL